MIGGAELEPGSGMYNPGAHPAHIVQAAINERRTLAAQYLRDSEDMPKVQAEVTRRQLVRSDAIARTGCSKHVVDRWNDRADPNCPSCKAAQTRFLKKEGTMQGPPRESSPADVRATWLNYAEHFNSTADTLQKHLASRSN